MDRRASSNAVGRRDFLRMLGVAGAALGLDACVGVGRGAAAPAKSRPNVVVILADDLGYAELGVQGCKDISTPNIDSIAQNGVRFTNGYVSCPLCSPTRAGLMAGRYQQRFGHEYNPGNATEADSAFGLPKTEVTLADRMKSLGYATGMFGKWHLGYKPELHPQQRGFDEFYGFLAGAHPYLSVGGGKLNSILRGTEPVSEIDYTTTAFAREAVGFIERHKEQPFFVYLPFNAVHGPLEAPEAYLARFSAIQDTKRRTFAAMLAALDDGVGAVLGALRSQGIEQDTLVFFLSDNGGPTPKTSSCNRPLRGYKAQMLEGGIRVPFLAQWKGHIPGGQVNEQPVISLDIHATAVAAANGLTKDMALDGVNLLPFLTGAQKGTIHESLCWRMGDQWAVRKGEWKLVSLRGSEPELYHLSEDIGEAKNLAEKEPERVKDLQSVYDVWNAKNVAPLWKPKAGAGKGGAKGAGKRAGKGKRKAERQK